MRKVALPLLGEFNPSTWMEKGTVELALVTLPMALRGVAATAGLVWFA